MSPKKSNKNFTNIRTFSWIDLKIDHTYALCNSKTFIRRRRQDEVEQDKGNNSFLLFLSVLSALF
jgi:hypothetical protein